ncbi:putative hydrolase of the HAD superfamily [Streptomyces sp. TE12347]
MSASASSTRCLPNGSVAVSRDGPEAGVPAGVGPIRAGAAPSWFPFWIIGPSVDQVVGERRALVSKEVDHRPGWSPDSIAARGLLLIVPLLMLDLDNTLVDRDAAFRDAVTAFLAEHHLPATDVMWVMAVDAGGYTARPDVAVAMNDRFRGRVPATAVQALLDRGGADHVVLTDVAREAVSRASADGWACVIVTNGRTVQQEAKIFRTGLDRLVQGWVISEKVGFKKPDPKIFHAAADAVGVPLVGAWMIGDSAHADIAGADALGLRSIWVSNGRAWEQASSRPTHITEDFATAIDRLISTAE